VFSVTKLIQRKRTFITLAMSVFAAASVFNSPYASAEIGPKSQTFGDYTVHYNAFTSDSLQPSMAKAYGITRSKNRGLVSISILKKSLSPLGKPVKAKVSAEANNLTGQWKSIPIREINDGGAVYYISEFRVAHKEVLTFKITAVPEDSDQELQVKFQQQFYTH